MLFNYFRQEMDERVPEHGAGGEADEKEQELLQVLAFHGEHCNPYERDETDKKDASQSPHPDCHHRKPGLEVYKGFCGNSPGFSG